MQVQFRFSLCLFLLFALSMTNQVIGQTETDAIELNIFPNPNRGTFYITVVNNESYSAQLIAMDGAVIKTLNLQSGLNYISIEAPAGMYILQVREGDKAAQFKIQIN